MEVRNMSHISRNILQDITNKENISSNLNNGTTFAMNKNIKKRDAKCMEKEIEKSENEA
jgi:hypothetical protein